MLIKIDDDSRIRIERSLNYTEGSGYQYQATLEEKKKVLFFNIWERKSYLNYCTREFNGIYKKDISNIYEILNAKRNIISNNLSIHDNAVRKFEKKGNKDV